MSEINEICCAEMKTSSQMSSCRERPVCRSVAQDEICCAENKSFAQMRSEAKNMEVEDALFKAATGYTKTVKKAYKLKDVHYDERGKKVETERLEICEEEQYFQPSLSAQTYWLKNRCPELWGEKREDEAQEQGGIVILPEVLEEEREQVKNE